MYVDWGANHQSIYMVIMKIDTYMIEELSRQQRKYMVLSKFIQNFLWGIFCEKINSLVTNDTSTLNFKWPWPWLINAIVECGSADIPVLLVLWMVWRCKDCQHGFEVANFRFPFCPDNIFWLHSYCNAIDFPQSYLRQILLWDMGSQHSHKY